MIAAAFYPRPVIVRLSDFKTNEYAKLIGGADFEPKEENPMLGFRGASRYCASGLRRRLCPRVRGTAARARGDGAHQSQGDGAVLPPRRGGAQRPGGDGEERPGARRERPRGLPHVRDPEQRHPDRCLRGAVRRLLDRLERPDAAHAGRRSRFADRRLRFRRARSRHVRDAAARGQSARIATVATSASAARRRRPIPRLPPSSSELGIDSISVNADSVPKTMKVVRDAEQTVLLKKVV